MSTEPAAKKSYKDTLNLPQTGFAMEAKLVQNEPKRLQKWQEMGLYQKVMEAHKSDPKWVLHDGPPFANGDIHIGHVINKTLKDVIIRFRSMQGHQTPYVPGWDCHGLPIEHKALEHLRTELGRAGAEAARLDVPIVRNWCRQYAEKYVGIQSTQFQRLGILGEWDNPYLTMAPSYEASTLEVFAKIVEKGLVYRKLKPVPWSVANQTALADAELEYQDVTDSSVYVEFPAADSSEVRRVFGWSGNLPVYFLVWTTTPWTLPANLAIAANPNLLYTLVEYVRNGQPRLAVIAEDLGCTLAQRVFTVAGMNYVQRLARLPGGKLLEAKLSYRHPFILERTGRLVGADYVTDQDGTGLVHTAPGHGEEDYKTGIREGLPIYSPVMHNGRFDDTAPEWLRGKTVWEANPVITQKLADLGLLFAEQKITHSYPHDWRSKTPIIFRATEQWFISVDEPYVAPDDTTGLPPMSLRDRAIAVVDAANEPETHDGQVLLSSAEHEREQLRLLDHIALATASGKDVAEAKTQFITEFNTRRRSAYMNRGSAIGFIPDWGRSRLSGMLQSRPDWCISRQRAWGLPIPVFYNEKGDALLTPQSVRAVAKRFGEKGSDAWFTDSPAELLGADFEYPPGFTADGLRKEKDIFDVWFESGSSWHAVLQGRPELTFPADLYLEGSDQHRGWFQLSLLPSLGATGQPPFKQVLTHGFVVKPDGTKVSKSDKEYVKAVDEINRHGADVLRLWCCSVDYQNDIPTSPQAIEEFGDKYRKIRNTLRFLSANLYDFDPAIDARPAPLNSLDGWASAELDKLIGDVTEAYEAYQLHRVFRLLHDFCSVQISSIYGNAMKDRLYCELPAAPLRRRCQTVLHRMLLAITKLLAPILVFTADEVWEAIGKKPAGDAELASVHLARLPEASGDVVPEPQRTEWRQLFELRDAALLQLDAIKKEAGLNKALDAEVIYQIDNATTRQRLASYGVDLEDLVGAGFHSLTGKPQEGPATSVKVLDRRTAYNACARSWKRRPDVGSDPEFPDLSARDAAAVRTMGR
jgi:isoleucyl-tRNA synthetase